VTVQSVAQSYQRSTQRIAAATAVSAYTYWQMVDANNLDASWAIAAPSVNALVGQGQVAVAAETDGYMSRLASAQHLEDSPRGNIDPEGFRDYGAGGLPVALTTANAIGYTKTLIGRGYDPAQALRSGGKRLSNLITTSVADQSRQAVSAAMATRDRDLFEGPQGYYTPGHYVRMVSAGACGRCIILAGKVYRHQADFLRHPGCLCTSVPIQEYRNDDVRVDPRAMFDSMSEEEQDRSFGAANAQAIRDGADMNRVVNATSSVSARSDGHATYVTESGQKATWAGTSGRDTYWGSSHGKTEPRLTPEAINKTGNTAGERIALLKYYGYII
jgi:hypothetical protein